MGQFEKKLTIVVVICFEPVASRRDRSAVQHHATPLHEAEGPVITLSLLTPGVGLRTESQC